MIPLLLPGFKNETFQIQHLVLDFNGTLAIDGKLIKGVKKRLKLLSTKLQIHVLTGNTFGTAQQELEGLPCQLVLLPQRNQSGEKESFTKTLENMDFIGIGNGRNDQEMLKSAAIGMVVIQKEGTAMDAISNADIIYGNILDALDAINQPLRLIAALRG